MGEKEKIKEPIMFEAITISSLSKVFPSERPLYPIKNGSCFLNETYSFQIAFQGDFKRKVVFRVRADDLEITLRKVELVPSYMAQNYEFCDDYYIKKGDVSGYYPDLLLPIDENGVSMHPYAWESVWVTVKPKTAGKKKIQIELFEEANPEFLLASQVFSLEVLSKELPPLDIPYTTWLYCDCFADWYKEELFSERYNEILFRFLQNATAHGMNTLLTPLFTPPLCTIKGKYNKTVQLVDVEVKGGKYSFDFTRLHAYMRLAEKAGFTNFELSHLATQWDVTCATKIMAKVEGKEERIFGWDTPCDGEKFLAFLDSFLPALNGFLTENGYKERCFFHVADEPILSGLEHYATVFEKLRERIPDCRIIDATTCGKYAERGVTDIPVVATSHVNDFPVEEYRYWVYYCYFQSYDYLSNRNFNMPSQRNRVMGYQLYANRVGGFLHWGFNSYYTSMGERLINPYFETDAGREYASGDPYLVYPAEDGSPYDSLRNEVFYEGIQDYRALKLLEGYTSREEVEELLLAEGVRGFTVYPRSADWHIEFREKINRIIMKKVKEHE